MLPAIHPEAPPSGGAAPLYSSEAGFLPASPPIGQTLSDDPYLPLGAIRLSSVRRERRPRKARWRAEAPPQYPSTMTDQPTRTGWEIRLIGSLHTGWGLTFNGEIKASHLSAFVLGAYLDAKLKGAGNRDAWLIAEAMAKRWVAIAGGTHGGVQG